MTVVLTLAECAQTIPGALLQGSGATVVSGITQDSRAVAPGAIFAAVPGASHDGAEFVAEAADRGAAAIAASASAAERIRAVTSLPLLLVPNIRVAVGPLSSRVYGSPSQAMDVIGVTGTNGKTTTTRILASILRAAGMRVGTIGTLGSELDGRVIPSEHTTPQADELQRVLAEMRDGGASAVVMEVSSHALAQERTAGVAFRGAIFTNLTQDHLDFHKTMEAYFEAKARLFTEYPVAPWRPASKPWTSSINVSSREGRELVSMSRGGVITYSLNHVPANLSAENVRAGAGSIAFDVVHHRGGAPSRFAVTAPIGGTFQVGNALAAIGMALGLGIEQAAICDGLAAMRAVPGRFESVAPAGFPFGVIVDYAHTPDGLENVLTAARDLKPAHVIVVFGCGGDRDRGKRPLMGEIGSRLADLTIVTSDNPRSEDPHAILREISAGVPADRADHVEVIADRRDAIGLAVRWARPGDLVVIAGKGHEDYQIIGNETLHFDDREVAREALTSLHPAGGAGC